MVPVVPAPCPSRRLNHSLQCSRPMQVRTVVTGRTVKLLMEDEHAGIEQAAAVGLLSLRHPAHPDSGIRGPRAAMFNEQHLDGKASSCRLTLGLLTSPPLASVHVRCRCWSICASAQFGPQRCRHFHSRSCGCSRTAREQF